MASRVSHRVAGRETDQLWGAPMFILYAVVAGLVVGLLAGGRIERLSTLRLSWIPLAVAGLLAQVLLFSPLLADRVGDAGPLLYVLSTLAVAAFVARNVRLTGFAVILLGGAANLVAIAANGGYMPADPGALLAAGRALAGGYSNSAVTAHPALAPLTDIFALPAWLPLANVFSVGDVLVGVGAFIVVMAAMRTPERAALAAS